MKIYVNNPYAVPGSERPKSYSRKTSFIAPTLAERGRKHWQKFHTCLLTPESLSEWEKEVASFECGCSEKYLSIKSRNKARLDDQDSWTWEIHNAVNQSLKRPIFTWDEYQSKWPWKRTPAGQTRIGIVSYGYEAVGGTETFHQALASNLPGVIGFASQNELRGSREALKVPCFEGTDAIKSIVDQSDVIISWNINWQSLAKPNRLIAVHHGSVEDGQGTALATQGDLLVAVNEEVASLLRTLTDTPVHWIPNAVDPERVKPRSAVDTHGKKICLWSHRFSPEKRPELAIQIAEHLPPDWHMVMTGHRGQLITPSDRVTALPPQHPGDWLSVASCFLSTAKFEGFGLAVAEAITAGVPVVSTLTGIASRPGLAMTLPIDAEPSEWASAIARSGNQTLPSRDLFSLDAHLEAWSDVIRLASES